jgi:hypothetical protein
VVDVFLANATQQIIQREGDDLSICRGASVELNESLMQQVSQVASFFDGPLNMPFLALTIPVRCKACGATAGFLL